MKKRIVAAILCGLLLAAIAPAQAQPFPNRPVKLIVPFPPGGPPDGIARLIGDHVGSRLGQPLVIENRPGAGATIGTRAVANAEPDGYTLLFGSTTSLSIGPAVFKNLDYDAIKSFAPVAGVTIGPLVIVVHPSVPAKSVQELVAYAKANPGKLNYGAGVATPPHVAWGLFNMVTGSDIVFIPYRGMAPAMTDLVGGQIQIMIDGTGPLLPHILEGKLRALAVTGATRSPDFPDLPTMIEIGYPDYQLAFWTGIVAPANTPADVVAKLNAAINDALRTEAVKAGIAKFNLEANVVSPQDFAAFLVGEAKKWGGVVQATGIKVE